MRKICSLCVLFLVSFNLSDVLFQSVQAKMTKEELIEKLKKMNITWTPGINHDLPANYTPASRQKKQICRGCRTVIPRTDQKPPPRFFDARNKWRGICKKVLNRIRHQGVCDGSWAVAAASMMTDRACIETGGKYTTHLSAEHLLNCCEKCRLGGYPGCGGGAPDEAVKFWVKDGLVTGGEVNTGEGCMPYSKDSFAGLNQDCPSECTNPHHPKSMEDDAQKGGRLYKVPKDETGIRQELFSKGPVLAQMKVYEDLDMYKKGVFVHVLGDEQGLHYVKIIGYGVENGKKYWLISNSHGKEFGDNGLLKILRGTDHCGIEENVIAADIESKDPPDTTEDEEVYDDEDPNERQAAVQSDGKQLEPSMGKCIILLEIIFFCLCIDLYI